MFERELRIYAFLLHYGKGLLADIPPEKMAFQPTPNSNTPAWHIGHLCVVGDFFCRVLGGESKCPREWREMFGRNSTPDPQAVGYPDKDTLIAAHIDTHERFSRAVAGIPAAKLEEPNPVADMRSVLPTFGDFTAHLLTSHEGTHLGQIAAWRNAVGLPRVF